MLSKSQLDWLLKDTTGCQIKIPVYALGKYEFSRFDRIVYAKWNGLCNEGLASGQGALLVTLLLTADEIWKLRGAAVHQVQFLIEGKTEKGNFTGKLDGQFGYGHSERDPTNFNPAMGKDKFTKWLIDGKELTYGEFLKATDSSAYLVYQQEEARRASERSKKIAEENAIESKKRARLIAIGCSDFYPGRVGKYNNGGWLGTWDDFVVRYVNAKQRTVTIEGRSSGNSIEHGQMKELDCIELLEHMK